MSAAVIEGAGEHALVPEAKDLRARTLAEWEWGSALLGDDFETPGATDQPEQRPNQARHHSQNEALGKSKSGRGIGGHCDDSSGVGGLVEPGL